MRRTEPLLDPPPSERGRSRQVLSAVENGNARRLCVLTEDAALQQRLAALSGVPLLRFARQVIVLEPPQRDERAAAEGAAEELARANDRRAALAPDAPDAAPKKRKRLREPNPLSCKKKKPAPAPTSSGASAEAGVKKRRRGRRRAAAPAAASEGEAGREPNPQCAQ